MRTLWKNILWTEMIITCSAALVYPLEPRPVPPKPPSITEPEFDSELQVKFMDDLQVRVVDGSLVSLVQADLGPVLDVKAQYGLTFEPLSDLSEEEFDFLEADAAQKSGIAQADLAGMAKVTGAPETIEAAANALLGLNHTEWVQFVIIDVERPLRYGELPRGVRAR